MILYGGRQAHTLKGLKGLTCNYHRCCTHHLSNNHINEANWSWVQKGKKRSEKENMSHCQAAPAPPLNMPRVLHGQRRFWQPQDPPHHTCGSAMTHPYSRTQKQSLSLPTPSQQAGNPRTDYDHCTRARHEDFASQSDSCSSAGVDSH